MNLLPKGNGMRIVGCIWIIMVLAWPTASNGETVNWRSFEDGLAEARTAGKNVFLYFDADWCGYCRMMEKETLGHEAVIAYLNRYFISIRIDGSRNKPMAQRFRIRGFPSSFFLDEKLEQVARLPGYVPPDNFYFYMEYTVSNAYEQFTPQQYYEKRFPE